MLVLLSPKLTLATLSLVPLLGAGMIMYRRKVKNLQRRLQDDKGATIGIAEERLANMETIRLFGKEEYEAKTFSNRLDKLYYDAKYDYILLFSYTASYNSASLMIFLISSVSEMLPLLMVL